MDQARQLPSTSKEIRDSVAPDKFRLDDGVWVSRQEGWGRGRWYLLALWAGLAAFVSGVLEVRDPSLLVWTLIGLGSAGGATLLIAFVFITPDPDSMAFKGDDIEFHRPNGRTFSLPLKKGVKVQLLDQSVYLGRRKPLLGPFPNYVLNHSSTIERISLTREAFQAVESELARRGATLVKRRELPLMPGSQISEYRL